MENTTVPSAVPPAIPPTVRPAPLPRRTRSGWRVASLVVGILVGLGALGMVAGGGFMLAGQGIATDRDGFFVAPTERVESNGVAVVASDIDLEADTEDAAWFLNWLDIDVRLRVNATSATDGIFVGIARSADVTEYLAGAGYSELTDVDNSTLRYDVVAGDDQVAPPTERGIWVAQASGTGEQELLWQPRSGQWSAVLMNVDGSAGVVADVDAAARTGAITPIAVTVLVIGGLGMLVAIGLIVFGARRGNGSSGRPLPPAPNAGMPMPPHPASPMAPGPTTPAPPTTSTPVSPAPSAPEAPTGPVEAEATADSPSNELVESR